MTAGRVSQWLRDGQIGHEALVGNGRYARIKAELATEMLRSRRLRYDDGAASAGLVAARTRMASLQAVLLQLRAARERGEVIPRAEAHATMEALGRGVRQAHSGIVAWSEEKTCRGGADWRRRCRFWPFTGQSC